MLKVVNEDLSPVLFLTKKDGEKNQILIKAEKTEEINGTFDIDFRLVLDQDKSQHITRGNLFEYQGQYFDIANFRKTHDSGGKEIEGTAEHVSYRLNKSEYDLEYFTKDGTPKEILEEILKDTPLEAGEVYTDDIITFSITQEMSRKSILFNFARYIDGEVEYEGFTVHIRERRGEQKNLPVRIGKNIQAIEQEVTVRDGSVRSNYDIDIVELSALPEYKEKGLDKLEQLNLGSDVEVTDEDLDINKVIHRVISKTEDLLEKYNSRIELDNFSEDLADSITEIERESVNRNRNINGIQIGEDFGFRATRLPEEDFRATMNATDGLIFEVYKDNEWIKQLYYDIEENLLKLTGALEGTTGTFSGELQAVSGTFSGELEAATGTFEGQIMVGATHAKDNSPVESEDGAQEKAEEEAEWSLEASKQDVAEAMNFSDYDHMVDEYAEAGETIIDGGYIRTGLIEAGTVITDAIAAGQAWFGELEAATGTFEGVITAQHAIIGQADEISTINIEMRDSYVTFRGADFGSNLAIARTDSLGGDLSNLDILVIRAEFTDLFGDITIGGKLGIYDDIYTDVDIDGDLDVIGTIYGDDLRIFGDGEFSGDVEASTGDFDSLAIENNLWIPGYTGLSDGRLRYFGGKLQLQVDGDWKDIAFA